MPISERWVPYSKTAIDITYSCSTLFLGLSKRSDLSDSDHLKTPPINSQVPWTNFFFLFPRRWWWCVLTKKMSDVGYRVVGYFGGIDGTMLFTKSCNNEPKLWKPKINSLFNDFVSLLFSAYGLPTYNLWYRCYIGAILELREI